MLFEEGEQNYMAIKSNKKPLLDEPAANEDTDFSAELIKQINKEAGNKIAFNLGTDEAPTTVKRWISTGSKQLDYIISNRRNGGVAEGRIVEIQGPPSSGKSHIAYEIAKSTQRMNGIVVYIDTENATSVENLEGLGIDIRKRFVFIQETCIEDIFKVIESTIEKARNLKADVPVTVIWDSVAASAPKAEIEGDYDQNTIGLAARVLSKGFRKVTDVIGDKNVCLVLLNQQRTKIGCVSPETMISYRPVGTNQERVGTMRSFFKETGIYFNSMIIGNPVDISGWEVKTLIADHNNFSEVVWKPVLRVVRKPSAPRINITTASGFSLDCSPDHKVFVRSVNFPCPSEWYAEAKDIYKTVKNYPLQIKTIGGWEPFQIKSSLEDIENADIEVEGEHSYLSNGILSHNTMYGDPTTTPGGMAIPYHASTRIKLTGGQQIKQSINGKEAVIGINVTCKTIKNKVARPWREVSFEIHFGKGVREDENVFDELREYCEKCKDPVIFEGKKIKLEGTSQWKYFQVNDVKTGEIIVDEKFYKSEFGSRILNNPEYADYVTALMDATFIMKNGDDNHKTVASIDLGSATEVEAAKVEKLGRAGKNLLAD